MPYLGAYSINDYLTFAVNTHNNKGQARDADAVPSYHIYEDETTAPIVTGTMALLNGSNTVGFYSERVQLTAASGFELGKAYNIYVEATVQGVQGTISHLFQIPPSITVTGTVSANVVSISGDTIAADNLEAQFDGTGVSGDTYPATQAQANNISISGAPSYEAPSSYVLSTGTQSGGTYASVDTSNAVYHTHTDNGGLLDLYYQYTLAGDEIATNVVFKGRITGINDSVNIQAYDWTNSAWVTLFTLAGTAGTTDTNQSPVLVAKYTGTGSDLGKVRIRIVNAVTLSTATLYVDQLIVGKTITNRTVGYQNGAVWIDTINGSSGTASWVNGTADNPVKTLAEAYTIASAVGLNAFELSAGSSITLTQSAANTRFIGAARIDLNGQSIADAYFRDIYTINGTSIGDDAEFINCGIGSGTFYHAYFIDCRFKGVTTFIANNEYIIIRGTDATAGAPNACQFIFDANVDAIFRAWTGGIQFNNLSATNTAIVDGAGRITLNSNCTGGSVTVRGFFPSITDQVVGGFLGTITDINRYGEDQNTYAITNGWVQSSGTVTTAGYVTVTGTVDANIVSSNNIDFTALQKTSLNASTPTAIQDGYVTVSGTVTATVPGTVIASAVQGGYVTVTGSVVASSVTNPVTVSGYVIVTGTVDANVEKWNTVDVVSNAIPAFAAGGAGGLATVDANNYVAGIQGTKNQLDDLNDIAAGAQMDLINVPNATAITAFTDDVFSEAVEGTVTFRQWLRRIGSTLFGKASGGGVAGSKKFRNMADTKDRVDATTDANGNRTSVTFDDT